MKYHAKVVNNSELAGQHQKLSLFLLRRPDAVPLAHLKNTQRWAELPCSQIFAVKKDTMKDGFYDGGWKMFHVRKLDISFVMFYVFYCYVCVL